MHVRREEKKKVATALTGEALFLKTLQHVTSTPNVERRSEAPQLPKPTFQKWGAQ